MVGRIKQVYDTDALNMMEDDTERLRLSLKKIKTIFYSNQREISDKIIVSLENSTIWNILVIMPTQSGKTLAMICFIYDYMKPKQIPIEHIFIITGLSSIEWKEQTKARVGKELEDRVYHRCDLTKKFFDKIHGLKNVLIIIDEIQIASKNEQTIKKVFEKAGFMDIDYIYENDIKIVEFSATPDGTLYDLMKWESGTEILIGRAGEGYTSSFNIYQQRRMKQFKCLDLIENVEEVRNDNIDRFSQQQPLYHLIRTPGASNQDSIIHNFKQVFGTDDLIYENFDQGNHVKDINFYLDCPPQKHTLIFIKEKLRCAKTLSKTYLGIVYERWTKKINDSVINQAFAGRLSGYDDSGFSICYTNIESIHKYQILENNNFKTDLFGWESNTTKIKNGKTIMSAITVLNPTNYLNSGDVREMNEVPPTYTCKVFENNFDEVRRFIQTTWNASVRKPKPSVDGLIRKKVNKQNILVTDSQINESVVNDVNSLHKGISNNKFKLFPVYSKLSPPYTINEIKSSLTWRLVYKV